MGGTIAMKTKYLAAIVIAVLASSTGLAANSVGSRPSEMPDAVQAAERLAQAVDQFLLRSGG